MMCSDKPQKADNMKKTNKSNQKRCKSKSSLSLSELKQLHKELREYLADLSAEINKLADNIDEVCQSVSSQMEEGLQEKGK